MKRLLGALLLSALALAQTPAYPETAFGLGYAPGQGVYLQGGLLLPFSPLGLDTGLDLEVLLGQNPQGEALFKANLFPGLVVESLYASLGVGLDLRYPFGAHLGPLFSLEIPGGALSARLGVGYQGGFHLAYGLGLRFYLDPLALEAAFSDRYPFRVSLLYLF